MKQLREVFFVPLQNDIKVWVAGDMTGKDLSMRGVDADLTQLEFDAFHHDGVVVVIVEEKDVPLVLK